MKITVLGMGAYGIALAKIFEFNENKIVLWTKFKEELDIVSLKRENLKVLPGIKIPKEIKLSSDLKKSVEDAEIIVIAVPANTVDIVSKELSQYIKEEQYICIASKGIEKITNRFMSDIVFENTKSNNICVISGPSFAIEVAQNAAFGLVAASNNQKASLVVKLCLENKNVKVVTSKDVIGLQACATIKNIYAILLGMLDSKEESTKATVLTNLIKDLKTIVEILGGKETTVFSYAGIGDFLLTCMSDKSRNYSFGKFLYEGLKEKEIYEKLGTNTVEGLSALKAVKHILDEKQIQINSIDALYDIIYNDKNPKEILNNIL